MRLAVELFEADRVATEVLEVGEDVFRGAVEVRRVETSCGGGGGRREWTGAVASEADAAANVVGDGDCGSCQGGEARGEAIARVVGAGAGAVLGIAVAVETVAAGGGGARAYEAVG